MRSKWMEQETEAGGDTQGSNKWNGNENDHGQMRGWFSEPQAGSCVAFQIV